MTRTVIASTVIIGDPHGMLRELEALIDKIQPVPEDTLVFAGDLLDKGPDPVGVVRFVRGLAKTFHVVLVEGNHEDKHRRFRRNLIERPETARTMLQNSPELRTSLELDSEDIAFLDGAVETWKDQEGNFAVVHGGIPGNLKGPLRDLSRKEFAQVCRTRYLDQTSGKMLVLGTEKPGDPFWAQVYDGRFGHVFFGHEPFLDGPRKFENATGLDTGCVFGGPLTAAVVHGDSTSFVQQPNLGFSIPRSYV